MAESILLLIRARAASLAPGVQIEDSRIRAVAEQMQIKVASSIASGTDWLTARQLFERVGRDPALASGTLGRWLREGRVFALTCGNVRIYPSYAFGTDGRPLPSLRAIVSCFDQRHPVAIAAWFESRSSILDGHRPREAIFEDCGMVLRAAQAHSLGPVHG